ncbi:MAG: hypothetical protein IJ250_04195 [Bacteroidales bacterium]|nr:hypothetical protein [Bacteroidales bacterium]
MISSTEKDKLKLDAFQNGSDFERRIDCLLAEELSRINQKEALKEILGLLDITTLNDCDNKASVEKIIEQSKYFIDGKPFTVAGICVYSDLLWVLNSSEISSQNIYKVAVSGGFPSAHCSLQSKLSDIAFAVDNGADEIDVPINRGLFLENIVQAENELKQMRKTISKGRNVKMKVILETSQLQAYGNVYNASMLAMQCGADFIKTSTGKTDKGADVYTSAVMMIAIRDFAEKENSRTVGFKAAGGIRNSLQALQYYALMKCFFGEKYITKDTFRIGCSSLIEQIKKNI